eukprot:169354-Amphidinium_carterae.1
MTLDLSSTYDISWKSSLQVVVVHNKGLSVRGGGLSLGNIGRRTVTTSLWYRATKLHEVACGALIMQTSQGLEGFKRSGRSVAQPSKHCTKLLGTDSFGLLAHSSDDTASALHGSACAG